MSGTFMLILSKDFRILLVLCLLFFSLTAYFLQEHYYMLSGWCFLFGLYAVCCNRSLLVQFFYIRQPYCSFPFFEKQRDWLYWFLPLLVFHGQFCITLINIHGSQGHKLACSKPSRCKSCHC